MNPHEVTRMFEKALCEYTGAPYAITTTSCTMALLLSCAYHKVDLVTIPKRTYVSVPMSVIHAGGRVEFVELNWFNGYSLHPYPILDSARTFYRGMWSKEDGFVCVSFHWNKPLGLSQGGAILHGEAKADKWLRQARFDGRTEGLTPDKDNIKFLGWHAYMTPEVAAHGLAKLAVLPDTIRPTPSYQDYPDISQMEVFK